MSLSISFLFTVGTIHMMCLTQYTDTQIIEAASTWLVQAPIRLKRAQTTTQQKQNLYNNPMEQFQNEDNIENI